MALYGILYGLAVVSVFTGSAAAPAYGNGFDLEQIRLGIAAHDLVSHTEDGPQIVADLMFTSPGSLAGWAGSPRPFLSGSFSTRGYTNLVSGGLAWDARLTSRLSIEGLFGISYNDGIDTVFPERDGEAEAQRIKDTRALLGSEWLFRIGGGADYAITDTWSVGIFYEHFSHGHILAGDRNQGLDEAGMRISYRWRQ